jgi:phage terminase small subunit
MTPKQKKFVKEYLIDLNATQAAIRAGYSKETAQEQGSRLLLNVMVKEAIQKELDKRSERTEITADMVLKQLAKIAFSDIKDFVEFGIKEDEVKELEDGTRIISVYSAVRIKPSDQVDGSILAEVSEGRDGIKIKRNDQTKALELLGRHLGMFNDKLDLTVKGVKLSELIDDEPDGTNES